MQLTAEQQNRLVEALREIARKGGPNVNGHHKRLTREECYQKARKVLMKLNIDWSKSAADYVSL